MKARMVVGVIVLCLVLSGGWLATRLWGSGNEQDLHTLTRDLRTMPGVAKVRSSYDYDGFLGSGYASTSVTMEPAATDEQVLDALALIEGRYSDTFGHDSANAVVSRGGVQLALHSMSSLSQRDAVRRIAAATLALAGQGQQIEAEIDVRREQQTPPPRGSILLRLPPGSRAAEVEARLAELAATGTPPGMDVEVLAADGSGLGGTSGVPGESDLALWRQVTALGNGHATVELGPSSYYDSADVSSLLAVNLTFPGPVRRHREEAAAILIAQAQAVRESRERVVLSGTYNGRDVVWLSTAHCASGGSALQETVARAVYGDRYDDPEACPPM